jgi:hypothetical protein
MTNIIMAAVSKDQESTGHYIKAALRAKKSSPTPTTTTTTTTTTTMACVLTVYCI